MSTNGNMTARISVALISLLLVFTVAYAPLQPNSIPVANAQAAGAASVALCGTAAAAGTAASVAAAPVGTVAAVATGGLPVFVTNNTSIIANTAITACNATTQTTFHQIFDPLAWAVAKQAIQAITKSMVNWINSGFQGSPAFVTNLDKNLLSVSDGQANAFFAALDGTGPGGVRSPFQDVLTQTLRNEYYSSTGRGGANSGYTLNNFSKNPAAFLAGGFNANGGFSAWFATVGNNQNNPFGAQYAQQNALAASLGTAAANRLQELNWGKGFMSWRGDCKVSAPAPKTPAATTDISVGGLTQSVPTSLSTADNCLQYDIKTPGSIVENTLGITVTSPLRQLELANSVNQIVGALATQLVNQVVGGVGLSGVSQPSAGGGPSVLSQATNPSQYTQANTSIASGFISIVSQAQIDTTNYLNNWKTLAAISLRCPATDTDPALVPANIRINAAITRGLAAADAVTKLNTDVTAAQTSTDPNALSNVSTEYQTYLSNGTLLTSDDVTNAQIQATTTAASGSTTTTLYDTLTKLCGAGT